jgi:hypothetical protein
MATGVIAESWAWLNMNAGGLGVSAAIVTTVVAALALIRTAKDSRESTRPIVIAEFRQSEHSTSSIRLVVKNYGQSAARRLSVTFDPPLAAPPEDNHRTKYTILRYETRIPILSPTAELENLWWYGINDGGPELVNAEPTPDRVNVKVSYKGNRWRPYRESFSLNTDTVKYTTTSRSSDSPQGKLMKAADALIAINETLKITNQRLASFSTRDT